MRISINDGAMVRTETSNWAVGVVLIYDRELTDDEMDNVRCRCCR